jgi:hypothetical protein
MGRLALLEEGATSTDHDPLFINVDGVRFVGGDGDQHGDAMGEEVPTPDQDAGRRRSKPKINPWSPG